MVRNERNNIYTKFKNVLTLLKSQTRCQTPATVSSKIYTHWMTCVNKQTVAEDSLQISHVKHLVSLAPPKRHSTGSLNGIYKYSIPHVHPL